jgi:ribosome-binding protein aMBF1 (putative translation factor)
MPETTTHPTATMPKGNEPGASPIGTTHRAGSRRRAERSSVYREELQRLAPYEGLARIVIARRQVLGLTQRELAERVGTSHSVISRIESGQHPASVTTLRRLAVAFETHLVIGFSDEPDAVANDGLVTVS